MRSRMSLYPVGTPWVIAPTFTGSASTPGIFDALMRSINAQGNVSSMPNRMPIFAITRPLAAGVTEPPSPRRHRRLRAMEQESHR